jgi:hypothetical protein
VGTEHTIGFIAGTPVWTRSGLVPIDQIGVGDVLLAPPNEYGADNEHASVTYVSTTPCDAIVALIYADPATPGRSATTHGWRPTRAVRLGDRLRCHDGKLMSVELVSPVFEVRPGVGWFPVAPTMDTIGHVIDFSGPTWRLLKSYVNQPLDMPDDGTRLSVKVFTLGVAGGGAYFIGSAGIRVSGASNLK